MKVSGEKLIQANRETVWDLLMDPNILQAVIPGCKSLEKINDSMYRFEIELKVAAIVGKYSGEIEIIDPEPLHKYTLKVDGSGALGHMNAVVTISLSEPEVRKETMLTYEGEAEIGGKVAKVGQRVLSSVANLVTNQFFGSFAKEIKQHTSL
jgi:uncharacterized protein